MYAEAPRGTPPNDPMFLWLVVLLQAYTRSSDANAVENAMFDRRWQMVLDCWGTEPVARTVELPRETCAFGYKALRRALERLAKVGTGVRRGILLLHSTTTLRR